MSVVSMKALLESGVHFGHQTRRWNPKMSQFIFTARNGIHIIDLQKTMQRIKTAYAAMKDVAVKVLTGRFADDPAARKALAQAAENWQALIHPHIVHAFDLRNEAQVTGDGHFRV